MYIVRLRHLHCIMKFPKHDQFHVDVSCLCCSNDFTSSIPTSLNIREGEPYFCGCKTLINKLINYHFMTSMHSSSTSDSRVGEIRCSQFVSNAWSVKVVHVVTIHTCSDCAFKRNFEEKFYERYLKNNNCHQFSMSIIKRFEIELRKPKTVPASYSMSWLPG